MLLKVGLSLAPVVCLVVALSVFRVRAWKAALGAAAVSLALSLACFREALPPGEIPAVVTGGIAFALHPISLVILAALFVYGVTVETGAMATIRRGFEGVSSDSRVLLLLVAWGFGNFMEGMAGFGTAVAIPAAILIGIGFDPFRSVLACLVANTVATACGSVGVPLVTLAKVSGCDLRSLAWTTGLLQLPLMALTPALTLVAYGGFGALRGMGTMLAVSSAAFLLPWLATVRFLGAELPDVIGALSTMAAVTLTATGGRLGGDFRAQARAWAPFGFVVLILAVSALLPAGIRCFASPGVLVLAAGLLGGAVQGLGLGRMLRLLVRTARTYSAAFVTICAVLAMARVMTEAGMIATLADAVVSLTGRAYPLCAPVVGAVGGFVTGSGTNACVLFGALQTKAATALAVSPDVLAAANVLGAGVGKMISPQSIAIGAAVASLTGRTGELFKRALVWFAVALALASLTSGLACLVLTWP